MISAPHRATLVAGGYAGWLVLTALSQHPHRMFDRFRRHDPLGLMLPNWRFFAPEPARHDFHVLHRVRRASGTTSPWVLSTRIAPRVVQHAVWFPGRRREKAMFDISNELILQMTGNNGQVVDTPAYRTLCRHVESVVREDTSEDPPTGFQFVLAQHSGHDESEDPEYIFVSPYVLLRHHEADQEGAAA